MQVHFNPPKTSEEGKPGEVNKISSIQGSANFQIFQIFSSNLPMLSAQNFYYLANRQSGTEKIEGLALIMFILLFQLFGRCLYSARY